MALLGALAVFVGWITAVALVVVIRSMVEYPLLEIAGLEAGAPVPELYLWARVAYGGMAGLVGGFVTAWLAPRAPLRHALVLALLVAAPAALYALPRRGGEPPGHDAASILVPVIAVLAGGWLRGRLERRGGPADRTSGDGE